MSAWRLLARPHLELVELQLLLRDLGGEDLPWLELPLVDPHEPREVALVARLVTGASGRSVRAADVIRAVRSAA
jgi:hypothetical protein